MTTTEQRLAPSSHAWWDHEHPDSELAVAIERFIADHGHDAWIEVLFLYRTTAPDEVHTLVEVAAELSGPALHIVVLSFVHTHQAARP